MYEWPSIFQSVSWTSDNGVFYDCIKFRIDRVVVAFVSWIFHCAIETHECWFT